MVGLNRPERRILSRAYLSGTQTLPKVCISRKSVSVQSAPIQPKHSAKSFYQGASSNHWIASLGRRSYIYHYLDDCLIVGEFRRYAESFSRAISTHIAGRRLSHQCKEVRTSFHPKTWSFWEGDRKLSSGQGNASCQKDRTHSPLLPVIPTGRVYRPARLFLQLLGLMTSSILLVPYARLYMRPFQLHLHARWKARYQSLQHPVLITRHLLPHVQWWSNVINLSAGLSWLKNRRSLLAVDLPTNPASYQLPGNVGSFQLPQSV